MLARHGLTLGDETKDRHRLFAIGSVLHFASDGAVIWGSGVNGKIPADRHTFRNLDVRAVRGPFTRGFLMERSIAVPEVYGDPGLLLPHLTPGRFVATREKGPVFVPNLNDLTVLNEIKGHSVPIISPVTSWNRCISALLQHSLVLSSSLHGIVIAEAYGIPARYVRLTDEENLFKYRDYYAGTGRAQFSYASSIAEGLEMGGETAPIFDPEPLLRAFPFELWS
jgi:pyruvyltransferase